MLYLVQFTLTTTNYMADSRDSHEVRLVEANSAEDAELKLQNHYAGQSDPYGYSYMVFDVVAHEAIR